MGASIGLTFPGVHHITAICGDPQRNIDFYVELLGLRLVKRTVNFDDPGTYHFYYGDGLGSPGTVMTFFPWILPPGVSARGRQGTGQVTVTSFWIPETSVDYWIDRLAAEAIPFDGPSTRFDETVIAFRDPDGLVLELVARPGGKLRAPWKEGPVPTEHAIVGFAGATFSLADHVPTARLLTETMGFRPVGQEGSRFRFQVGEGPDAAMIDLLSEPDGEPGRVGIGTVHHIAWRALTGDDQLAWQRVLTQAGFHVTPVQDRNYFESVYFRERGGVLFEIATDPPGFTRDETPEELGSGLKLPPWLEPHREQIERSLPDIRLPGGPRS